MCNPVSDRAEANKRITMQINVECLPDVCIEQWGRDCGKIKERRKRNFHSMSLDMLLSTIQTQAVARLFRVTDHAREEMEDETITLVEVLQAIATGQIIENYPEHRRGSCCLISGVTDQGHPLHVVCTTSLPLLVFITVYIPTLPKWKSPTERRT